MAGAGVPQVGRSPVARALRRFADEVDALSILAGRAAAWLYPLLVAVLIVNVVLRYGFSRGVIELEELQWHLYAAAFLIGFSYTCAVDEHVRVDLLRRRFSSRLRAWVELAGSLLLLLPFSSLLCYHAFWFFWRSWSLAERSSMPSGLPARWLIKGVLFLAMLLLALQALAGVARSAEQLLARRADDPA